MGYALCTATFPFVFYAQFFKDFFHQAPFCKRWLQQIDAHKTREPQPINIHIYSQQKANQNKSSGNCPDISVNHNYKF